MVVRDFIKEHGLQALVDRTKVKVSRHGKYPNLVMLKYDQIESPMGDPLTQKCRGLILDESADWRVVSYPYDKFFNHGEGHAADIDWDTASVYEKLDGSIMTLYYYDGAWQVASNGSPDASGPVNDNKEKTFAGLFWETFHSLGYRLPTEDCQDVCYMFELMTMENRVVVPHPKPRLVLHGARWLDSEVRYPELPPYVGEDFGWEIVKTYDFDDVGSVLAMAESAKGIELEGFVVCDHNYNRLKIKSKTYVALHHIRSSFSNRRMLELIQAGEQSEFLSYFPEYREAFIETELKFENVCRKAEALFNTNRMCETQKEFALAVKDSPFAAALFATRAGKVPSVRAWFKTMDSKKLLELLSTLSQLVKKSAVNRCYPGSSPGGGAKGTYEGK